MVVGTGRGGAGVTAVMGNWAVAIGALPAPAASIRSGPASSFPFDGVGLNVYVVLRMCYPPHGVQYNGILRSFCHFSFLDYVCFVFGHCETAYGTMFGHIRTHETLVDLGCK